MSDLDTTVADDIAAHTPGVAPPFAHLTERKRRRDRRRLVGGTTAVTLAVVTGFTAWSAGALDRGRSDDLTGTSPTAPTAPVTRPPASPPAGMQSEPAAVITDTYGLVDDRTLLVQVAVGGGCQQTGTASGVAGVSADKVQLQIVVTRPVSPPPNPSQACTANLIVRDVFVPLPAPLGDRKVIDEVRHKTLHRAPAGAPVGPGIKAPPPVKLTRTDEFGLVTSLTDNGGGLTVAVDRVDMLSGAEAAAAAGHAVSNDYYLRNDNHATRTYAVDADAVVWGSIVLLPRDEPWPKPMSLEQWVSFVRAHLGQRPMFHFEVENGRVVGIEEQYTP